MKIRERTENGRTVLQVDITAIPAGETAPVRFRLKPPEHVTSRSGAERWGKEALAAILRDGRPHSTKAAREERQAKVAAEEAARVPTLAEWAPVFLAHLQAQRRKASSIESRTIILNSHLLPALGTLTLTECCASEAIDKLKSRLTTLGPRRVNAITAQLTMMLSLAAPRYSLTVPEVPFLKVPRTTAVLCYSDAQREQIIKAIATCPPRWQVIALLALDGGLRIGEIAGLQWASINFEAGVIEVRHSLSRKGVLTSTKSGSSRTVPMSSRLRAALGAHTGAEDFVVTGERSKKPCCYAGVAGSWKAVLRRAGVPLLSPHKGRHTWATALLRSGTDLATVRDLCGHANIKTTAVYLHSDDATARRAIARLEGVTDASPAHRPRPAQARNPNVTTT